MKSTTIIHINIRLRLAVVTVDGVSRMYRLRHTYPLAVIAMYKRLGYLCSWIAADTALLTGRTAIEVSTEAKAA